MEKQSKHVECCGGQKQVNKEDVNFSLFKEKLTVKKNSAFESP